MQFVSVDEYLMGRSKLMDLSSELQANVNTIVPKANELLEKFGEYRKVNSGYRRPEDNAKVPHPKLHSKHLTCEAIDLEDADGKLHLFCKSNEQLLVDLGLWCEERQGGWQHLQIVPPGSGHRWFIP